MSYLKSQAASELLRRREARNDFFKFIKFCNPEYIESHFSKAVCVAIEQFIADCIDGKRPILILAAPPQHGKSTIVSRYLPAYIFGKFLELGLSVAGTSYNATIASDMGRDVQKIMQSDEYQILFSESKLGEKRKGIQNKQNANTFEIGEKGVYRGVGVGGGLTGRRVDIGIIDDPIKNHKEALSDTVKESVWNWYTTTFLTRLSKCSGHIIMATRWAEDDLTGRVLEDDKEGRCTHLEFPAINEHNQPLVEELHPLEKLKEIQKTMGNYFWSALFQQRPIPLGGNYFNETDLLINGLPIELPRHCAHIFAIIDTAVKSGVDHDSTAVGYFAFIKYPEPLLIILDYDAVSIDSALLIKWLPSVQEHLEYLSANVIKALNGYSLNIEDKASGSTLLQQCQLDGIEVNALPSEFTAIGKTERAIAVSGMVFNGKVKFSERAYNKTILLNGATRNHLLSQIIRFRLGVDNKTDDLFDVFCYGIGISLLEYL